jgi:hypothetical protein
MSRTLGFSLSVVFFAVSVALSAPSGPDSPRAKFGRWLRAHGYQEIATVIEPTQLPDGSGLTLPPLP